MRILYITYFMLAFHPETSAQKKEEIKWILGIWKIQGRQGMIAEQWTVKNDSTLTGKSFFIRNGKDSSLRETVDLAFRNGSWYYIPTVRDQNNAQPVSFPLIFLKNQEFICENPAHDFPQRITYRRIKNQLFASIEGRKNNQYSKQNFDFLAE